MVVGGGDEGDVGLVRRDLTADGGKIRGALDGNVVFPQNPADFLVLRVDWQVRVDEEPILHIGISLLVLSVAGITRRMFLRCLPAGRYQRVRQRLVSGR